MRPLALLIALAAALACITGCDEPSADTPPSVRLGDSVCVECNMIISDERWATATVVESPRGAEPLLFDDFNCQVNHEVAHPELHILARWSHDHTTSEWIRTEQATFLISPGLRTPMGSKIAAFATPAGANAAKDELTGDVMTFDTAWKRLDSAGTWRDDTNTPEQEHDDDP